MLLVPPGAFQMGCTDESPGGCTSAELPVHTVTLTNPVYLGRFEITQGQFLNTMNFNPAFFSIWWYSPGMPVEQVTWDSIQGYLARTGFRLPTEAEWEFACRAGTTTAFYNGSNDDTGLGSLGWYVGNSIGLTHGVGEKQPNRLGFYDMAGNVWEWVSDFYGPYSAEAQVNPTGAMSGTRVLRGGSFTDGSGSLRSSSRMAASPDVLYYRNGGFRVARNP
jgi:formylglycine-generating enzyme required for sulfatase activity